MQNDKYNQIIYNMYVTDKLSAKHISVKLNVDESVVLDLLERLGVRLRVRNPFKMTKDELIVEYIDNNLTIPEISEKYGYGTTTISTNINRHKIHKDFKKLTEARLRRIRETNLAKYGVDNCFS